MPDHSEAIDLAERVIKERFSTGTQSVLAKAVISMAGEIEELRKGETWAQIQENAPCGAGGGRIRLSEPTPPAAKDQP